MATEISIRSSHMCFGGQVVFYSHKSTETQTKMNFSIFLPDKKVTTKIPGLIYLAGLTCTDDTFMIKSGVQKYAAKHGDTSFC